MTRKPIRVLGTQASINIICDPSGSVAVTSNIDDAEAIRHFLQEALSSAPRKPSTIINHGYPYSASN